MDSALEQLEQTQRELEQVAGEVEEFTGVNRREFVFLSLVAAAASTFGVRGAQAQRGGAGGAGGAQQAAPPPIPLGNGEPPAMVFQAYPGGTGALMEKLIRERGAKAFERSVFTVEKWSGAMPSSDEEIAFLPAHRLSALIKEKKITSVRLTEIYLERMKRLDPSLLCAVTIMETQGRAEAQRADAEIASGKYRGALHGIPYGIKDLFSTKGVRTTWGSKEFENRIIDEDAEMVVRLRDAGAVLIAKLATGRFANNDTWFRGRTNNPWDIRRGSSGSSAGPASATAAGCVAFGIGTETSGSIVSPSRECGLSALRPTFGRTSRYGGMTLSWTQDRVGPICRTIEDCAMVFNTMHGVDVKDPSTITAPFQFDRHIKLASLRIGVDAGAPKDFVDKLKELGANPTPIGPRPQNPPGGGGGGGGESTAAFDSYVQAKAKELGIDMAAFEAASGNGRGGGRGGRGGAADSTAAGRGGRGAADSTATGRGGRGAADSTAGRGATAIVDPAIATLNAIGFPGANGRNARALDFLQNQRRRQILITKWGEFLKDYDMYIPGAGFDVGIHSSTGHPCAVVPANFERRVLTSGPGNVAVGPGRGGRGADSTAGPPVMTNPMPTCAVIAGNLFNDDMILSVAHQYQMATEWHLKHPKL
jgi:hypothetical protein